MKKLLVTGLATMAISANAFAASECAETQTREAMLAAISGLQSAVTMSQDKPEQTPEQRAELLKLVQKVQEIEAKSQEYFKAVGKQYLLGGVALTIGGKTFEMGKRGSRFEGNIGGAVLFEMSKEECGGVDFTVPTLTEVGITVPTTNLVSRDDRGTLFMGVTEVKLIFAPANVVKQGLRSEDLSGLYVTPLGFRKQTAKEGSYRGISVSFRASGASYSSILDVNDSTEGFVDTISAHGSELLKTVTNPVAVVSYNMLKGRMSNDRSVPVGARYLSFKSASDRAKSFSNLVDYFSGTKRVPVIEEQN